MQKGRESAQLIMEEEVVEGAAKITTEAADPEVMKFSICMLNSLCVCVRSADILRFLASEV